MIESDRFAAMQEGLASLLPFDPGREIRILDPGAACIPRTVSGPSWPA